MKARCIQNLNIDGAEFLAGTIYNFEMRECYDNTYFPETFENRKEHQYIRYECHVICSMAGRPVPSVVYFFDSKFVEKYPKDDLGFKTIPFEQYFQILQEVGEVEEAPKRPKVDLTDHIIYPNFKPSFENMERFKHEVLNYPKPCKKLTIEVEMTYPQSEEVSTNDTMEIMRSYFQEWLNKVFAGGQDLFRFSRLKVINDNQTLEIH